MKTQTKGTKEFYERLTAKILLQAIKDYINPAEPTRNQIKGLKKDDENYDELVAAYFAEHRQGILKSLRSDYMDFITNGKSVVVARKLETSDLKALKRKMKEEEKRIEFEESIEKHKYDYKVESIV